MLFPSWFAPGYPLRGAVASSSLLTLELPSTPRPGLLVEFVS